MVEFINQFKLDYYGKPVKIGWPFRPSIGFLNQSTILHGYPLVVSVNNCSTTDTVELH